MKHVICIGAGPAGLTTAFFLAKEGVKVTVIEKDPTYVGGISRTEEREGYRFDIGGHRFFSKSAEIMQIWKDMLKSDMIDRPRKSRIFYNQKFYPYPLEIGETLKNMGITTALACGFSYLKAKIFPIKKVVSFEDYIINNFGEKLYRIFFKTYTEKVWGMECSEISADWAAQRIKGLSLFSAVWNATGIPKLLHKKEGEVKTLITHFLYPKLGPGMMWEAFAREIKAMGGTILMAHEVTRIEQQVEKNWYVSVTHNGEEKKLIADAVISSMPMRELVHAIVPPVPPAILNAANALKYRDFLTVCLVVTEQNIFDDNWIYIHDPNVKVGRIQNFKSWSPHLIPDQSTNCYGLEYFCFEGDGLWNSSDAALVELAKKELAQLGLGSVEQVLKGYVVRQPKAYPVYDDDYKTNVQIIRDYLEAAHPNLHLIGRAGMHKYNNQDHAMMTGILTAKNIIAGEKLYDVWEVNQDAEYHEGSSTSGERLVPEKI